MCAASKLRALFSSLPVEEGEASDFSLAWDSSVAAAGKSWGTGRALVGAWGTGPGIQKATQLVRETVFFMSHSCV